MSMTSPKMRLGRSLDILKNKMRGSLSPMNLDLVYNKNVISENLRKKSRSRFGRVVKSVKETTNRMNPNGESTHESEDEVEKKHDFFLLLLKVIYRNQIMSNFYSYPIFTFRDSR